MRESRHAAVARDVADPGRHKRGGRLGVGVAMQIAVFPHRHDDEPFQTVAAVRAVRLFVLTHAGPLPIVPPNEGDFGRLGRAIRSGRSAGSDLQVSLYGLRSHEYRVSREHELPAGDVPSGRRAFASHEVEWSTRAMGALKNIRRTKMLAQEGRCYYCGLPMWDETPNDCPAADCRRNRQPKPLRCTAEHLLPRSEGGADTPENIVAACHFCNQRRHRAKCPRSPEAHRAHVRRRMATGRWLAAQVATGSGKTGRTSLS